MAAFPDRHGEGSVPSFHVMEGRRERNGAEFKPPALRYCLLPRLGNPSPNSSPTPSLSFLCLITALGGLKSLALARKELCGVETRVRSDVDVAGVGVD